MNEGIKIQLEQLKEAESKLQAIYDEMGGMISHQDKLILLKAKYELLLHPCGKITVIEKDLNHE